MALIHIDVVLSIYTDQIETLMWTFLFLRMHKRTPPPTARVLQEDPSASLDTEESLEPHSFNQSAPPETFSALPNLVSETIVDGVDTQTAKVNCLQIPVREPPTIPISQIISALPIAKPSPAPALGQEMSHSPSETHQHFTEVREYTFSIKIELLFLL